jgi:hypothetical protein
MNIISEVSEYREIPIPEVSDIYETVGYMGPGWLGAAYYLQLPGLIPVAIFTEPMPMHTYAKWPIYMADIFSICASWFAIGAFLDLRYGTGPLILTRLLSDGSSVFPNA